MMAACFFISRTTLPMTISVGGLTWLSRATPGKGGPGPDVGPFAAHGMAWGWLAQDGTDYFDLHHTADDTLDKIDPKALAQNVAAYAVFAYLAAEADGSFGSEAKDVVPPRE